jgi:Rrf2 family iron-sulfur cluster assembly transcriptional regulator
MRMSTKSRYAVNALVDLALREPAGPVSLASICQRQRVSLSYLEQLFGRMKRDGLVHSTRGPGGGYALARSAASITVEDIVAAVDEPAQHADDGGAPGPATGLCQRLQACLREQMAAITLDSLVAEQVALGVALAPRSQPRALPLRPVPRPLRTTAPNSVFAFGRSFA